MAAQRPPVTVEVTPKLVQGNTVICEIDGNPPIVKGGVINLKRGGSYQLVFELQDGDLPSLKFDESSPGAAFWCDMNSCPTSAMNNSNEQLQNPNVTNGGRTLTLDADPKGQKNAVHYSLNFDNGCRYDPVIIND